MQMDENERKEFQSRARLDSKITRWRDYGGCATMENQERTPMLDHKEEEEGGAMSHWEGRPNGNLVVN